tara:strand:+ start:2305 stop:2553 length:249 start_codon:yes stop_codon:yes gene_type:complete
LKGRPNNEEVQCELLGIIDDCVYAALTSDFTIKVLHTMLMSIGYTEELLKERNSSIDGLTDEQKQEYQDKYKWEAAQHGFRP